MSTELMRVDEKTVVAIEEACEQCNLAKLATLSPIRRTLVLAKGMQAIRNHLTGPVMKDIMALANTPLGFLTDRKPGQRDKHGKEVTPYSEAVIRDCVVEGMLRGASIIGNEMNVLVGRCYLTKAYFERAVREWPGLTHLAITEGVPMRTTSSKYVLVPMRASWQLNGVPQELRCEHTSEVDSRIPVIENEGMAADAVLGKAKRKLFAKIFARLAGSEWIAEQAELDGDAVDVESTPVATEEAAVEPENTQAPTPAEELFRGIEAILTGLEQITDVDQYQANAAALLTDDDDLAKLNEWCEWRRAAIREGRGTRSNGKE